MSAVRHGIRISLLVLCVMGLVCPAPAAQSNNAAQATKAYNDAVQLRELLGKVSMPTHREWLECAQAFHAAYQANPQSRFAGDALYEEGLLYQQLGDVFSDDDHYRKAISTLDLLVNNYRNNVHTPDALRRISNIHKKLGNNEAAQETEQLLRNRYPEEAARLNSIARNKTATAKTKPALPSTPAVNRAGATPPPTTLEPTIKIISPPESETNATPLTTSTPTVTDTPTGTAVATSPPAKTAPQPVSPPQPARNPPLTPATITDITWESRANTIRVTIKFSAPVDYNYDMLDKPDRIYFDMENARLDSRYKSKPIITNNRFFLRVRSSQNGNSVRIVFDITGIEHYTVNTLRDPFRIVTELHPGVTEPAARPEPHQQNPAIFPITAGPKSRLTSITTPPPLAPATGRVTSAPPATERETSAPPATGRETAVPATQQVPTMVLRPVPTRPAILILGGTTESAPTTENATSAMPNTTATKTITPGTVAPQQSVTPTPPPVASSIASSTTTVISGTTQHVSTAPRSATNPAQRTTAPLQSTNEQTQPLTVTSTQRETVNTTTAVTTSAPTHQIASVTPTRPAVNSTHQETIVTPKRETEPVRQHARTSNGDRTLTRMLGLKIGRVVLDPGHGGDDEGAIGKNGAREKDLVLAIALDLRELLESEAGLEVIMTRDSDITVPLERRTQIANENQADLFLSIHANSSTITTLSGVETYYLNFAKTNAERELAARENAMSSLPVSELDNLIRKIAAADMAAESREFASIIQRNLFSGTSKLIPKSQNRGVRTAPFTILIGANMPAVLAEIAFISNPTDEKILSDQENQKQFARALYAGITRYMETLGGSVVHNNAYDPQSDY